MGSVTRLHRICAALCALTLGASARLAHADVVSFVRTGRVAQVDAGNPLGLAVGDPVRLELSFDRELVLGPTPTVSTLPVQKDGPFIGRRLGIRLEIAGRVLTEREDEQCSRRAGGTPQLGAGSERPTVLEYMPVFTQGGRSFRLATSLDRIDILDTTNGEVPIGRVVFDQSIDPPPFAVPPLRDGSFVLLDDQRRLEHRCFTPPV